MSVCGRSHCQISENPHSTVGAVALIAFVARIIHKFAVDLQLGVRTEYIADISDIAIGHHIYTVMIGLSGFKSGDFVFISAAEEICGNRTGFAVQLPPRSSQYVVYIIGHIAGEYGFIAVLEADSGVIDLHHINSFLGGRRHGQYIHEPNGFAVIVYTDLIRCQGDFFTVDIELCVLIKAVALSHAQVGNLEIYAIGVTLSGFKFRNELAVVTLVPVVAGGNAIATAVIGVPTLMVEINKRIHGAGHKARFVAGIKFDTSNKVNFLYSLTGAQLCSICNEASFSIIHHHDPRTERQTCSVQCDIFCVCQITVEGIAVFRLKFHGIFVSSALFKGAESNIAVRIAAFIGIPIANRVHAVIGVFLNLFPALVGNIIFVLIGACLLGRRPWGITRLIVEFHILNIDGSERAVLFCRCNRFHSREIQVFPTQTRFYAFSIHCNGGFAVEGISILRLQHKKIHITLAAFKFCDGRQRAMRAVIGVPCGNWFVVFKLLPTFIVNFIFLCIGSRHLCRCLRSITRLIVEFRILNRRHRDGVRRLTVFLHNQVIGCLIHLILMNNNILIHTSGSCVFESILIADEYIAIWCNNITTLKMIKNKCAITVFSGNISSRRKLCNDFIINSFDFCLHRITVKIAFNEIP